MHLQEGELRGEAPTGLGSRLRAIWAEFQGLGYLEPNLIVGSRWAHSFGPADFSPHGEGHDQKRVGEAPPKAQGPGVLLPGSKRVCL